MSKALDDVVKERNRQEDLFDEFDKTNTRNDWIAYISAYAGRASDKVLKNNRENQDFRDNMKKVAALAIAAMDAHDNGYC